MNKINRREFLKRGLAAGSVLALGNTSDLVTRVFGQKEAQKKIIILGFDGMDPHLVDVWMKQGKLPAFQKLKSMGDSRSLRTSDPPQSPVAWSNFITGMNPGGHGIFDFLHRDPETYFPISSAAASSEGQKTISLGNYVFPISGGKVEQIRQGKAYWQYLEDHGIPATLFKIPSNYPPVPTKQKTLSGMGTPDMLGSSGGIFNYYTNQTARINEDIGGGRIHEVYVIGNQVEAKLPGPENTFKKDKPETSIDFKVYIDPVNPVAKIAIQDQEFILKEGEWSGWKKVSYGLIPTQSVSGICMFYLQEVRPEFKLYVSPINIDPSDPALPISTPGSYAKELEKKFGFFYTQGLPADYAALSNDVLDEEEFLYQEDIVLQERREMYEYELSNFDSGLFFYYVSSTDQRQHMFWRLLDKSHPTYDEKLASKFGDTIERIYRTADEILDKAMQKADKDTIIMAMSDHGFTTFRREFNLNTWLKKSGYLHLINDSKEGRNEFFLNTDWSRTRAYALGLNSLYVNERGRESEGIVSKGEEKEILVREIAEKLEKYEDPETGERPILKASVAKDILQGSLVDTAPDIFIGYNRGYRASWATPLGNAPEGITQDNMDKWSGTHCIAPDITPGIFFTNRKIKAESPALYDLTATILDIFNIDIPDDMIGKPVF
jgi:predicted AlkP superfamily phosphohydrolase/phosphomutase